MRTPSANILAMPNGPVTNITPSTVSVPATFFGMHVMQRANDGQTSLTCKTVRSHDMENGKGRWKFIETADNVWDFTAMDLWVNAHYAAGRDLVFTLFGTPTFFSARDTEQGAYGPANLGIQAEPSDMTKWDRFCTKMVTRYLGKIKYWEVWNEPNIGNNGAGLDGTNANFFWSGTWAKLSEMTRRANQAIKAVDPTAKIISSPVQGWASSGTDTSGTYFAGMMAASSGDVGNTPMKNWVDIVGVHLYSANTGETLSGLIDRALAARAAAGMTGKEIWDTESTATGVQAANLNDTQLTRFLTRTLLTMAAKGIHRHIYYSADSTLFGFFSRPALVTHWNDVRTLLMSGNIQAVSRLWDGRIAYWTGADPTIV